MMLPGSSVVSTAKMTLVSRARDAAGEDGDHADEGGHADVDGGVGEESDDRDAADASKASPPMVNTGARVPPAVPLPREIVQERNFIIPRRASIFNVSECSSMWLML